MLKNMQKNLEGWAEFVEPNTEVALYWHDVWRQNNSPRNGLLADIMRSTWAKYHYSIIFIRKKQIGSVLRVNGAEFVWQLRHVCDF